MGVPVIEPTPSLRPVFSCGHKLHVCAVVDKVHTSQGKAERRRKSVLCVTPHLIVLCDLNGTVRRAIPLAELQGLAVQVRPQGAQGGGAGAGPVTLKKEPGEAVGMVLDEALELLEVKPGGAADEQQFGAYVGRRLEIINAKTVRELDEAEQEIRNSPSPILGFARPHETLVLLKPDQSHHAADLLVAFPCGEARSEPRSAAECVARIRAACAAMKGAPLPVEAVRPDDDLRQHARAARVKLSPQRQVEGRGERLRSMSPALLGARRGRASAVDSPPQSPPLAPHFSTFSIQPGAEQGAPQPSNTQGPVESFPRPPPPAEPSVEDVTPGAHGGGGPRATQRSAQPPDTTQYSASAVTIDWHPDSAPAEGGRPVCRPAALPGAAPREDAPPDGTCGAPQGGQPGLDAARGESTWGPANRHGLHSIARTATAQRLASELPIRPQPAQPASSRGYLQIGRGPVTTPPPPPEQQQPLWGPVPVWDAETGQCPTCGVSQHGDSPVTRTLTAAAAPTLIALPSAATLSAAASVSPTAVHTAPTYAPTLSRLTEALPPPRLASASTPAAAAAGDGNGGHAADAAPPADAGAARSLRDAVADALSVIARRRSDAAAAGRQSAAARQSTAERHSAGRRGKLRASVSPPAASSRGPGPSRAPAPGARAALSPRRRAPAAVVSPAPPTVGVQRRH
eukprot:TRINITY_DN22987_c0_g1_i2.p1 TRINITY_DN22987_c0_g1~~TRINITY_DN22987_c0_g1_i2.p1  ORF type:complete len:712 (+),score=166.71 TRINITY_DN22987_c0_g1_i2:86-2137(+)